MITGYNNIGRIATRNVWSLLAVLALLMASCKDSNDEPVATEEFGNQKYLELPADISAILPEGEATLSLVYENGETPLLVKVNHYVRCGKSVLDFGRRLRTGDYVVASATRSDGDESADETHLGCRMKVESNSNSAYPSTFDIAKSLFGSGTPEDPYLIASANGLKIMRTLFAEGRHQSKDVCFLQIADIDMTRYYNKGFVPICARSAYPFAGSYDGGGHSIYYCAVRTFEGGGTSEMVPATGLFGYAAGATFRNVTMVDPVSEGAGSTGTLVGAVVGIGGFDNTPTMFRNVRVRQQSSTASKVKGSQFVGGIVGGVDANAVLMMSGCVNENLVVDGGSFSGGLVGGGTINSTVMLDSCVNRAAVINGGSRCKGGIIGGVETANISNCVNYGRVDAGPCMGVGGIAGGLGSSVLAAVVNYGEVSGGMGTGGIVGSTVLSRGDGCFNDVVMTSGHNYGSVRGSGNTGGIVGEAQAMLTDCYNRGPVVCSGTFAGGMIGFAPVAAIHSCYNNGPVSAAQCAAGIVGRSAYYVLIGNSNLSSVSSSGGMAAGILALGGSTGMVNFCANYGPIEGTDVSGGIVAKAGESYSLVESDVCSLVENYAKTTWKVLRAFNIPPFKVSDFMVALKKGQKVLKIFNSAIDVLKAVFTPEQLDDLDYWNSLYEKELPARNEELTALMHSDVAYSMPAFDFALGGIEQLPEKVNGNMTDFNNALQDDNDDKLSMAVHDRLADIDQQVAQVEQNREIAIAATSCVLAVAGMVVSGSGAVVTVLACSATVSAVGTFSQRFDNCVEISQCCNFGKVNAGDKGYGIVARLGDHVRLLECLSAGECSGYGISDKSDAPMDDIVAYRTISVGKINQNPYSEDNTLIYNGHFALADNDKNASSSGQSCFTTAEELADRSTYSRYVNPPYDFDENRYWAFLVPAVPAPYNNRYFSFR